MANDIDPSATLLDREVAESALEGLLAPRKSLPPKLFYDEEGCRLFYRITALPEYYLTRAETEPLKRAAEHIAAVMTPGASLVEYGASDETKALVLLRAARPDKRRVFASYVPIDVAGPSLHALQDRLARSVPDVAVHPVCADFTRAVALPSAITGAPALGFFPGSTIGNMEPSEAASFLRRAHAA
ncbi:MAG: L-histidine N(alpha)-methyltransferase, partial [Acetobacteraceae bacterium]